MGGVLTVGYYLYFVVIRTSLEALDCTWDELRQRSTLDAEPSLECWHGEHAALVPWAATSLGVYGAGIPAVFGIVLWRSRDAIRRDQCRWLAERGDSVTSNPDIGTCRRFARLYQDFVPRYYWWRLVLLGRKFCFLFVTIMASGNPLFQVSVALSVLAVSYGLHVKYASFVSPASQSRITVGAVDSEHRETTISRDGLEIMRHVLVLNTLEMMFLPCSIGLLLGGMMFQSSRYAEGSAPYVILTVGVCVVLVGSVLLFALMVTLETCRSTGKPTRRDACGLAAGAVMTTEVSNKLPSHRVPAIRDKVPDAVSPK